MKINEICQKTGLTKKAVAYYQEKGLISPASQENGYREFTQEEAGRLGTIAFLRRLGLPVQEIALLLASPGMPVQPSWYKRDKRTGSPSRKNSWSC